MGNKYVKYENKIRVNAIDRIVKLHLLPHVKGSHPCVLKPQSLQ